MAQQIKLRYDNHTLDLTAAPYSIGPDFVPPASVSDDVIATGSSANIYGGGVLAGRKFNDRAWTFSVKVIGTTRADIQASVRRLASFLQEADYIDFRQDANVPEPLWGQFGAALTYEIITARTIELWSAYGNDATRDDAVFVTVETTIKPFAEGGKQMLAISTGAIFDDTFGRVDGVPGGIVISESATNLFTNPVFGNSTFGTLWTAGVNLTVTQNTDSDFLLPVQTNNALIISAGTANNTYTQSLSLGSGTIHTISALVKLPDSGSVSSTQMQITYGGTAQTTTYTSFGNGFYYAAGTVNGTGGSLATGVVVKNGYGIYLAAMQAEAKPYRTFLANGDMLGCAWSGTAHASTTTRTAGSCKLQIDNTIVNRAQGSIRVVVKWNSLTQTSVHYLFDLRDGSHTTAPRAYLDGANGYVSFDCGAVSLASDPISVNTLYVFHFCWSPSGMTLYRNSVADDTGAFTSATFATYMFIGSDYSSANQLNGVIAGFATFDRALTSAQVLADYGAIAPIVARGDRVESVPWLWINGTNQQVGLGAGNTPRAVVGGIDGNANAITEIQMSNASTWASVGSVAMSCYPCDVNIPLDELLHDLSGTALAGDYGGQHKVSTISSSTPADISGSFTISFERANHIRGIEFVSLVRLKTSAAGTFSIYNHYTDQGSIISDPTTIVSGTAYNYYLTKPLIFSNRVTQYTGRDQGNITVELFGAVSSGTVTASLDYFATLPRPVAIFSSGGGEDSFLYRAPYANAFNTGVARFLSAPISKTGDEIEFAPNKLNIMQYYVAGSVGSYDMYAIIQALHVTPRWALL